MPAVHALYVSAIYYQYVIVSRDRVKERVTTAGTYWQSLTNSPEMTWARRWMILIAVDALLALMAGAIRLSPSRLLPCRTLAHSASPPFFLKSAHHHFTDELRLQYKNKKNK